MPRVPKMTSCDPPDRCPFRKDEDARNCRENGREITRRVASASAGGQSRRRTQTWLPRRVPIAQVIEWTPCRQSAWKLPSYPEEADEGCERECRPEEYDLAHGHICRNRFDENSHRRKDCAGEYAQHDAEGRAVQLFRLRAALILHMPPPPTVKTRDETRICRSPRRAMSLFAGEIERLTRSLRAVGNRRRLSDHPTDMPPSSRLQSFKNCFDA